MTDLLTPAEREMRERMERELGYMYGNHQVARDVLALIDALQAAREAINTARSQYPSWCCQKCGAGIGWLGRFFQWTRLPVQNCPGLARGGGCA